jgi:hypothetical protein
MFSELEMENLPPYNATIEKLFEMKWIQCPIQKLNHIYTCLKFNLAEEIDDFYNKINEKVHNHFTNAVNQNIELFS